MGLSSPTHRSQTDAFSTPDLSDRRIDVADESGELPDAHPIVPPAVAARAREGVFHLRINGESPWYEVTVSRGLHRSLGKAVVAPVLGAAAPGATLASVSAVALHGMAASLEWPTEQYASSGGQPVAIEITIAGRVKAAPSMLRRLGSMWSLALGRQRPVVTIVGESSDGPAGSSARGSGQGAPGTSRFVPIDSAWQSGFITAALAEADGNAEGPLPSIARASAAAAARADEEREEAVLAEAAREKAARLQQEEAAARAEARSQQSQHAEGHCTVNTQAVRRASEGVAAARAEGVQNSMMCI